MGWSCSWLTASVARLSRNLQQAERTSLVNDRGVVEPSSVAVVTLQQQGCAGCRLIVVGKLLSTHAWGTRSRAPIHPQVVAADLANSS